MWKKAVAICLNDLPRADEKVDGQPQSGQPFLSHRAEYCSGSFQLSFSSSLIVQVGYVSGTQDRSGSLRIAQDVDEWVFLQRCCVTPSSSSATDYTINYEMNPLDI
jgi:hypothetical protein